jgi:Xaa-Pro dipeptidase
MTKTTEPAAWRGFSETERDRRWSAVRARATAEGLDCILVPLALDSMAFRPQLDQPTATGANGRYLTQLDGAVVIFPARDDTAPIVITERSSRNSWLAETRTSGRGWLEPTVQALREAGMERARIGVVGLGSGEFTLANSVDGVVVHSAYVELLSALPDATFQDATDVIGAARFVKSAEEIDALRRASQIAEAGLETLVQQARPGMSESALYARVMGRMLSLGSPYVPLALATGPADQPRYWHVDPQPGRILEAGWLIEAEVRAAWGGLVAYETQSVILGPVPSPLSELAEIQARALAAGLTLAAPGRSLADLAAAMREAGSENGMRTGVALRGCGYGDDGPMYDLASANSEITPALAANTTWSCRLATSATTPGTRLLWGTTFVVTDTGAATLSGRQPSLLSI